MSCCWSYPWWGSWIFHVFFPCFWSYPWWVSWIFQVFLQVFDLIHDELLGISMCFSRFLILSVIFIYIYIYICIIFIINANNIRCSSKHMLTTAFHVAWSYPWWGSWIFHVFFHVCDFINDDFLGNSMCFCRFLILSMIYIYI